MTLLFLICVFVGLFLLWFETDFIADYLRLLKPNWSIWGEYDKARANYLTQTFIEFLYEESRGNPFKRFYLKLLNCPFCLGVWLALLISILVGEWLAAPFVYVFGLLGYFVVRKLSRV
jgi:pilus assembly protein TadC